MYCAPSHALALCAALVMTMLRYGSNKPFYDRLVVVVVAEDAFSAASFPRFPLPPTSIDPPEPGGGRKERGRVCLRRLIYTFDKCVRLLGSKRLWRRRRRRSEGEAVPSRDDENRILCCGCGGDEKKKRCFFFVSCLMISAGLCGSCYPTVVTGTGTTISECNQWGTAPAESGGCG